MPKTPNDRPSYRAPGAVALYLQRMGRGGRVFLALVALWVVGIFATAILITLGILPLVASIWLFIGLIFLGGWANWSARAAKYEKYERSVGEAADE